MAINDILKEWNIPSGCFQLSYKELLEEEIDEPFIVFLLNGEFALVHELKSSGAVISNFKFSRKVFPYSTFENEYSGFCLFANKEADSGEEAYTEKYRSEILKKIRVPFLTGMAIVVLGTLFFFNNGANEIDILRVLILIAKLVGVSITSLLLIHTIDANNPFIQKLCGKSPKRNCNTVLSSNSAKLIPELSWSEIGFFYFTGTALALIFCLHNNFLLKILSVFNLFCLPYTVYSLYHQWKVLKNWCVLCCIVQGLLWLEFLLFVQFDFTLADTNFISYKEITSFIICLFIPILFWILMKPFLVTSLNTHVLKRQLQLFKFNEKNFKNRLIEITQKPIPLLDEKDSIIVGNSNGDVTITLVSNPYCSVCSYVHETLENIINKRGNIKMQMIFLTRPHEDDPGTKVASHLFAIHENGVYNVQEAAKKWYKHGNYNHLSREYPIPSLTDNQVMSKHNHWCKEHDIQHTPTILIDGRLLPDEYMVQDIKYLI